MAQEEIIELRSEKIQNIIGQIPPPLIKIGISVIFFVFLLVLAGSYFFEYEYELKTTAEITPLGNSAITVKVRIPVNYAEIIKPGQQVELSFDNIPNMYGQRIITYLTEIQKTILISENGGYYISFVSLSTPVKLASGSILEFNRPVVVVAGIQIGKVRFFDKIVEPIRTILKK